MSTPTTAAEVNKVPVKKKKKKKGRKKERKKEKDIKLRGHRVWL